MTQTILPPATPPHLGKQAQLAELARRYKAASGTGMQVMVMLGGQAEGLLDRLPSTVRAGLDAATMQALEVSFSAAQASRGPLPETGHWLTRAMTMATGAAGGFGGMPTALAELPITTTVILRAIQGISMEYGFDPAHPDTRVDCLRVFAAAGPLEADDGADLSFLTLRTSVTGATVQGLISRIAPRLATTMGQKLAAQTVPVLGAVSGAAINFAFTSYFQEIAHVQFGLRKLAEEGGYDRAALVAEFSELVSTS